MTTFRELRQTAKIKQASIARLVGVTRATVSRWEGGSRRISAEAAIKIDDASGGKIPKEILRPDIFFDLPISPDTPEPSPFLRPKAAPETIVLSGQKNLARIDDTKRDK